MVLALVARGADPNLRSQFGATALGQALQYGGVSVVEALIHNGARCQFVNEAVGMEDFEGVKRLLEEGADPNDIRPFGNDVNSQQKPLFYAVARENAEIVILLLDNGANPNFKVSCPVPPWYRSLLSFSHEKGNPQIVNALLKADAVSSFPGLPPQLTRGMG